MRFNWNGSNSSKVWMKKTYNQTFDELFYLYVENMKDIVLGNVYDVKKRNSDQNRKHQYKVVFIDPEINHGQQVIGCVAV